MRCICYSFFTLLKIQFKRASKDSVRISSLRIITQFLPAHWHKFKESGGRWLLLKSIYGVSTFVTNKLDAIHSDLFQFFIQATVVTVGPFCVWDDIIAESVDISLSFYWTRFSSC